MTAIKAPNKYENQWGILKNSGDYIKEIGKKAFIIGGKTALQITRKDLEKSLIKNDISYSIEEFSGYNTIEKVKSIGSYINNNGSDVIVGVGGGRVLDLVKAIGNDIDIPIVTIPTIAATCAAWSAVSVFYNDKGEYQYYTRLEKSPALILADKEILSSAPKRYINSGVADTLVKWYEVYPNIKNDKDNLYIRTQLKIAEVALEISEHEYIDLIERNYDSEKAEVIDRVIDSNIMLAGLVGSIQGSNAYGGIAHPFYNASTKVSDTALSLHGEKVGFGLIVQLILEKQNQEKIKEVVRILKILGTPTTLREMGIINDVKSKVEIIAKNIFLEIYDYKNIYKIEDKTVIEEAILEANAIGENS